MSRFSYKAKDSAGVLQKGLVEATSIKQATNLLHERGFYIVELKEVFSGFIDKTFRGYSISFNDLVHLTRQLSTMTTAGLTVVESLSILEMQLQKSSLIRLVNQLEDGVQGGKSLAQIMENMPHVFPPSYIALIKAGEASGKLDLVFSRLAENLEKSRDFRNKIKGALIYPSIVVSGMIIVAVIVITVVIPRLSVLYSEFGVELPLPTRILISISSLIVSGWGMYLVIIAVAAIMFIQFRKTSIGKHSFAYMIISMPIIGSLIRQSNLVEITRLLSILIDGGVPILTALEISKNATNNLLFQEAFEDARKKVEKGFALSEPLLENRLFPPILGQMVNVGEKTGKLGDSLNKVSRYFETEADTVVRSLTTLIEPLIMVILGLGVGFLVMAVLLPIYSITSQL